MDILVEAQQILEECQHKHYDRYYPTVTCPVCEKHSFDRNVELYTYQGIIWHYICRLCFTEFDMFESFKEV